MGALESLAEGTDAGPGRNVRVMLESTAEVSSRSSHAVVKHANQCVLEQPDFFFVKLTSVKVVWPLWDAWDPARRALVLHVVALAQDAHHAG